MRLNLPPRQNFVGMVRYFLDLVEAGNLFLLGCLAPITLLIRTWNVTYHE